MRLSKYFSMYARTCQAISETTSQTPRQINYEAGFKSMKAHARSNDKIALWVFNFLKNETNMPDYVLNYVLMHHAKFIYNHPEQFMRNIKLLPVSVHHNITFFFYLFLTTFVFFFQTKNFKQQFFFTVLRVLQ